MKKYHEVAPDVPPLFSFTTSLVFLAALSMVVMLWPGSPTWAAQKSSRSPVVEKKAPKTKPAKKPAKKAPKATQKRSREVQAKAVYCVNLASNETLMSRNPDQRLPVASLTKLVTALVALDRMSLDQKLTVPDEVKTIPKSVVGLKPGDQVSVKDLLHGLLMRSGNDCAETLACAYPGGRKEFIKDMNKKVRRMGTRHTVFHTPSGLDAKVECSKKEGKAPQLLTNVSTAREMARIARVAFSNTTIRAICLKQSHVIASTNSNHSYRVKSTNKLLRDNLPLIGGKTGYTARAGHCLASEFTPGKNVLLIVVLGSPDHFRDTRLVYKKALEKTHETRGPQTQHPKPHRVAAR